MSTLANLSVSISANLTKFSKGLAKGRKSLVKFTRDIPMLNRKASTSFLAVGAASAVGLGFLIKRTVDAGDAMDKMSKRTGMAAQFLSKLSFAADLSGTSIEDIEKGSRRLSKAALDTSRGLVTYKRDFDQLGVSVTDQNGNLKSSQRLFLETAAAIAKVKNNTTQAALASNLFGRAGTRLLPMFTDGRKGLEGMMKTAQDMSFVWTNKAAAAAASLKDNVSVLTQSITKHATAFAVELIPHIDKAVVSMTSFFKSNQQVMAQKVSGWAETVGKGMEKAYATVAKWSADGRLRLWFEQAKAAFLGFKLVGVTVWEGLAGAFNLWVSGMAQQLGQVQRLFEFTFGNIQVFMGKWVESFAKHMTGVPGMDIEGRRALEFGSSLVTQGRGNILSAQRGDNDLLKMSGKFWDKALDSGDAIGKAAKEYGEQAQKVANLMEIVQQNSERTMTPIVQAANKTLEAVKGTQEAGPAAAPGRDLSKLGKFGKVVNTSLVSIPGLAGSSKPQSVRDPANERIVEILSRIERRREGNARNVAVLA